MTNAGGATETPSAPAYKLPGVNLFASGFYRGQKWPPDRVKSIADNIRKNGPSGTKLLIPPAVMGHEEDQKWLDDTSLPAAGWVDPDSVTTVADPDHPGELILRGDVVNVPPEVAEKIKSGEFANGSGEFYELSDDFGKSQGFTMRRFGLLGGEVPQVKRLGRLPMPVPMDAIKVFAESKTAPPSGGATFILAFSERQTMDRNAACNAIKAVMPGLSQANLDAMSDDMLNELVANLPAPPAASPAPVIPITPAPMAEATPEEMIAALVAAGQDQATVAAMSPADLKAAYDLVKGATPMADDPNKKPDAPADPAKKEPDGDEVAKMSEKAAASLKRITDLEASAAAREKAAAARQQKAKVSDAEAFCEKLVREGRLLPFQKADYVGVLTALDDTHALHKFSENGTTEILTAFERKKRELERRPLMVKFGEKVPGGSAADATPEAKKASALTKAKEHAATVPDAVWKQTSYGTGAGFVQKFSEVFDKNAELAMQMIA